MRRAPRTPEHATHLDGLEAREQALRGESVAREVEQRAAHEDTRAHDPDLGLAGLDLGMLVRVRLLACIELLLELGRFKRVEPVGLNVVPFARDPNGRTSDTSRVSSIGR